MIDKGQGFYHIGAYIYRIGPDGDMVRATSARPVLHGGSLMVCATFGDETYHFPSAPFRVLDVVENQAVIDADFRRENGRDIVPNVVAPEVVMPELSEAQAEKLREAGKLGDGNVKGTTFNGLRQLKLVEGSSLTELGKSVLAQITS